MTYINHLTITTGHSRRSFRSEVDDEVIKTIQYWIKRALRSGDIHPLPGEFGHDYGATVVERPGLIVTVYRISSDESRAIVKFGVARRSRQGAALWQILAAGMGINAVEQPSAPWCAALPYPAMIGDSASMWIGDFERCVAWAWIDQE